MPTRTFAFVLAAGFILVGVLGFIPGITSMHHGDHPNLAVEGPGHGYLLGLFHVNVLHNLVHIAFGVIGILMLQMGKPRDYCRFVAIAYGLLAVLGLIPVLNVQYTFGLIPIEGNDVWLHALIALAAAYFGWMHPYTTVRTDPTTTTRIDPA